MIDKGDKLVQKHQVSRSTAAIFIAHVVLLITSLYVHPLYTSTPIDERLP